MLVHYRRVSLEVLGDVVPVRGMVRHQIAPTILEQLKVREVEVLLCTADVQSKALQACEHLQSFLVAQKFGKGRVVLHQVNVGHVALAGKVNDRQSRVIDRYLPARDGLSRRPR